MTYEYVCGSDQSMLRTALEALGEEYPLVAKGGDVRLVFRASGKAARTYRVQQAGDEWMIEYGDLTSGLRAVGSVLSLGGRAAGLKETNGFETFGIMLDCSRNAVMKVSHFKGWLRKLSLMGYNMAMLYTEDTYQLEGEPYFGYQRGAYSTAELREIDAYARRLGIEMIPCVQTLGHMSQVLKWSAYQSVMDTRSVLLAGEEKTYKLLEKMLAHWSEVFTTRRIHVGMDEAHDLGRGHYMDRVGYRNGFDIFNEHLDRVVRLCQEHGYTPMIWSDMYFRLGSRTGDYYDRGTVIPPEVSSRIPKQAQLVYWDYYHVDKGFYADWIARHRAMGFEPIMASGVWTWAALWHATNYTEAKAGACVEACRESGLREVLFTLWGDDGAICDFDSALAGLTYAADLAWSSKTEPTPTAARFAAICGGDYEANRLAGGLSFFEPVPVADGDQHTGIWAHPTLWDDPLLGIYWNDKAVSIKDGWARALEHYRALSGKLDAASHRCRDTRGGDLRHAAILAKVLAARVGLRGELVKAYAGRDRGALRRVAAAVPDVVALLEELDGSYRAQWLRRNKPFGLEVLQGRLAGLIRRYRELVERIGEFVDARIDRIAELDDAPKVPVAVPPYHRSVSSACGHWE